MMPPHVRIAIELAVVLLCVTAPAPGGDWVTFGGDNQRTGWARDERSITVDNVGDFDLLWKQQVDNENKSLTALTVPIVVTGVKTEAGERDLVYVAGSGDVLYALDASTGERVWEVAFKMEVTAASEGFWLCPKGLNATPAADKAKGVLYVLPSNGRLYTLDLATGKERFRSMQMVPPYAKAWSLAVEGDRVYTSVSQNCGDTPSGVVMIDLSDPMNYVVRTWRSAKFAAGIWGRGGALLGNDGWVYGATGDGDWNPEERNFGQSVIALDPKTLELVDYFTPENWDYVRKRDFDIGTSPTAFIYRNREYVAVGGKEGLVYLVEAPRPGETRMGGPTHHHAVYTSPLLANEEEWFEAKGVWGNLSFYRDEDNRHWVYAPLWGPTASKGPKYPMTNGDNPNGSVAAFLVKIHPETGKPWLEPAWVSGDFAVPEPVVIANGVLFALGNGENARQTVDAGIFKRGEFTLLKDNQRVESEKRAVLRALDATTGKQLWESEPFDSWTHFSGLALADGKVYAVDFDNKVYCFGVRQD